MLNTILLTFASLLLISCGMNQDPQPVSAIKSNSIKEKSGELIAEEKVFFSEVFIGMGAIIPLDPNLCIVKDMIVKYQFTSRGQSLWTTSLSGTTRDLTKAERRSVNSMFERLNVSESKEGSDLVISATIKRTSCGPNDVKWVVLYR